MRAAERRVLETTIALHTPISDTPTAAIVMPRPVRGGCRSKVDGRRCGHAKSVHLQVGFHAGERHRCACGCKAYVSPFERVIVALLATIIALPFVAAFWFGFVPALIEMMT